MANVVVVGSQWGDEGKGKIVDWLSERADLVVRFQGGHNAGHTLVIDGVSYKLSLLPSGVVRPGKVGVIGNGVVIDPHALIAEIGRLGEQGVSITPDNLKIADNATLILSLHRELDGLRVVQPCLHRQDRSRAAWCRSWCPLRLHPRANHPVRGVATRSMSRCLRFSDCRV